MAYFGSESTAPQVPLDAPLVEGQDMEFQGQAASSGLQVGEGELNLSTRALVQRLQGMDRAQLEEFAQELFVSLKVNEAAVVNARRAAARRPGGGTRRGPTVISAAGYSGSATMESAQMSTRRGQGSASAGALGSPRLSGGMRRGGSSAPIASSAAAGSSSAASSGVIPAADGAEYFEAQQGGPPRSPRAQAVTEAERQQIFNRLYNSAREQRIRRRTHQELGKLHDEVRMAAMQARVDPRIYTQPLSAAASYARRGGQGY